MLVDYHMHLRAGNGDLAHTPQAVEPFVQVARSRGIDEIGFTEHVYYFTHTRALWDVPYHVQRCAYDLERYVEAVLEAKRRGLPVKLGLEVDYVRGREDETRELLAPYPWDYLLGSIHFVDGRGIDGEPRLIDDVGVEQAWVTYFDELAAAAQSRLFDVMSHPDLVKIFGLRPERPLVDELHLAAAEAIAEAGVAIEVSTAGLRKPVGEPYPDPHFLRACRERGVPITLASDAHEPRYVGEDVGVAVAMAHDAGYDTVTVFDARTHRQEPIG